MFAVRIKINLLFARSSSLPRPASLDLGFFTNPSEMRLFTSSSIKVVYKRPNSFLLVRILMGNSCKFQVLIHIHHKNNDLYFHLKKYNIHFL